MNSYIEGELWWDSVNDQLSVSNGSTTIKIGPESNKRASWETIDETLPSTLEKPVILGSIGSNSVAVVSEDSFVPISTSRLQSDFSNVRPGITLAGVNSSGSSKDAGYYFWGTAAEALIANTSTGLSVVTTSSNQTYYIPFVSTLTGNSDAFADAGIAYNPSTNVLSTIASSARYADLAERYFADAPYEVGTVVVIGGSREITMSSTHGDTAVAGVISQHPAYRMNSAAGTDETHPYVALRGRVPCKVIGKIKKGGLLVSSSYPGYAEMMQSKDSPNAVIGKALQDFDGAKGIIEILI